MGKKGKPTKVKKKAAKAKKISSTKTLGKKRKLSKKEIESYREQLLDLKDDFMKKIQEITEESLRKPQNEASGDITNYSLHLADRASDTYERDFSLGLVSAERKIVAEIDEALRRIEDNEYGFCLKCGKPIAKRRLDAIPYARHGTKCQKEIEEERE